MAKRWIGWIIWSIAVGLLYFFENNTATRIMVLCSMLLPLSEIVMIVIAMRRIHVTLEAPHRAEKCMDFAVAIRIDCPFLPVHFRVALKCSNNLTGETQCVDAWAHRTGLCRAEIKLVMNAKHCGMYKLEGRMTVGGFLNLFDRSNTLNEKEYIWVAPIIHRIDLSTLKSDTMPESVISTQYRQGWDNSDTSSVREYVPGDSIRLIHWKLSEKTDTVMLREMEKPWAEKILLVFDLSNDSVQFSSDMVDSMTEVLFSLSNTLMDTGIPHSVFWKSAVRFQNRLHSIESEADQIEFGAAFFADKPERHIPITLDDFANDYAHIIVIGQPSCIRNMRSSMGQSITLISTNHSTDENFATNRTIQLPENEDMWEALL